MRAFSCAEVGGGDGTGEASTEGWAGVLLAVEEALLSALGFRPGFFFAGRGAVVSGFLSSGKTSGSAELGGCSGFSSKGYGGGCRMILS